MEMYRVVKDNSKVFLSTPTEKIIVTSQDRSQGGAEEEQEEEMRRET
jgi:hypothetical protein